MDAPLGTGVVHFIASREPGYVRNQVLLNILRRLPIKLRVHVSEAPSYPIRLFRVISSFILAMRRRPSTRPVVFAGFLGQPVALVLGPLFRPALVLDSFISIYDTLCLDRRTFSPTGFMGRLLFWCDYMAYRFSDLVLVDTAAQKSFLMETFSIPEQKLVVVPVGTNEAVFYPRPQRTVKPRTVFYYSSDLPLHGLDIVIQAAHILRDSGIRFRIAGRLKEPLPSNVENLGWLTETEIAEEAATAALCLAGHFSTIPKALRVVPGKAYQFMGLGKAIIVSRGTANEAIFADRVDAFFCEPGSAQSLADTIVAALGSDLVEVGGRAREKFISHASEEVLSGLVHAAIQKARMASH